MRGFYFSDCSNDLTKFTRTNMYIFVKTELVAPEINSTLYSLFVLPPTLKKKKGKRKKT